MYTYIIIYIYIYTYISIYKTTNTWNMLFEHPEHFAPRTAGPNTGNILFEQRSEDGGALRSRARQALSHTLGCSSKMFRVSGKYAVYNMI